MKTEILNHGFIEPVIKPEDYVFGDGKTGSEVLQPTGQWDSFLPSDEYQSRPSLETYNCTSFGTTNLCEILLKRKYGVDINYSERFLGINAGTKPPGNSPDKVADAIREYGLLEDFRLPFSDEVKTVEEYYSPNPMTARLAEFGKEWLRNWVFKHSWVFTGGSLESKQYKLAEALKDSPIGVSVYAWNQASTGLYEKPVGATDNHWCTLYGYEFGQYWKIFDHYDDTHKQLAWNYDFGFAKKINITKLDAQAIKSLQERLIELLKKVVAYFTGEIKKVQEATHTPPTIPLLAKAIEAYENVRKELNNPGGLRWSPFQNGSITQSTTGKPLATFATYEDGFKALLYQITIVCKGTSPAYTLEAVKLGLTSCADLTIEQFLNIYAPRHENQTPAYVNYVCGRLKVANTTLMRSFI